MNSIIAIPNHISYSNRNESTFTRSLSITFAVSQWIGAFGIVSVHFFAKKIYRKCPSINIIIQRIYLRLFTKDVLRENFLKKKPANDFTIYHKLRIERDFLRRIPLINWSNLLDKIRTLDLNHFSLDAMRAFELGKWDHPIFKHSEWPILAFYLYLEGFLEEKHITKLLLFDACLKESIPSLSKKHISNVNTIR